MSTNNLPSKKLNSQFIILSNGQAVEVPAGADLVYFKRFEEARLKLAANPKKKAKRTYTPKPSKKSNYARMQSVLAMATLELVSRVNTRQDDPEPRFINGNLEVW